MTINELMERRQISKYRLSKTSGVPYTTVNDICNGKAKLDKCSAETVYKLSKALGVSMEFLMEPFFEERVSFELFRIRACSLAKELGDLQFIVEILRNDEVRRNYKRGWIPESFYMLGLLDYLSRVNLIPLCNEYDDLREMKLDEVIFASGTAKEGFDKSSNEIPADIAKDAIPEFAHFNIVEYNVRISV